VDLDAIPSFLETLEEEVRRSMLSLDSPREEWSAAVANWLSSDIRDAS
jgi:F-type H+-transporting ATPase subunit alpha